MRCGYRKKSTDYGKRKRHIMDGRRSSSSKKKTKGDADGGEQNSSRPWADLEKDVLLTIYQKLDVKNLVMGAPLCCSSWYKAAKDPSLWKDVDCRFFDYGSRYKQIRPLDLVDFVTARSQGLLNSITFPSNRLCSIKEFLLVAERCPRLKHFDLFVPHKIIRRGKATVHAALSKLKELESMEVSDYFLSDEATLQVISQNCPKLSKLKLGTLSLKTASLISKSLPKLKVLDLSNTATGRDALLVILRDCKELESLDVSLLTTTTIGNDAEILKLAGRLKEFKWDDSYEVPDPWGLGYGGLTESSSDSESERYRGKRVSNVNYYNYDIFDYYD